MICGVEILIPLIQNGTYVRNLAASLLIVLSIPITADQLVASGARRKIACKTPANAKSCYWTHGRLTYGNGTPAVRLWKIGTHRLLGIYSGPSVDRDGLDNEHPELPANLGWDSDFLSTRIFADFEVCPLEEERPRTMQAACIEAAKNITVVK